MRSPYFYSEGPDSFLFSLPYHTDPCERGSCDGGWQCDVGPGDIAYTYTIDDQDRFLRREEIPYQRAPRWRRRR